MISKLSSIIFAGLMAGMSGAHAVDIEVTDARARPTAGPMGVVYMTLTNQEEEEIVVTGISTPVAETAELHTTVKEGNRFMRMVKLEDLALPPGRPVEFTSGGLHVMLIKLEQPLEEGKGFPLTLVITDEEGQEEELTVPVQVQADKIN